MEVLSSFVGSLAGKAAEYAVEPTARQLRYLFKHKSMFRNLRSNVQELKDAKERVQQSVDAANRDGGVIFDDVQRWLAVAGEKISEDAARQLQEDEETAMKRCLAGFCLDFKSRHRLSKRAEKEAIAIAELLKQKFDIVSRPFVPKAIDIIKPVEEYEAFDSRNHALNDVITALKDDNVNIIGVYGMGGVGKTTLVTDVARQAEEKLYFAEVVFVRVAQAPDTVHIQNEIANQLGLKLNDHPSVGVRAALLCDRLKKARVLIVLDDIWKKLEVTTLGIPSVDQHKGCKILMTSRNSDVLKSMGSQKLFPIDELNEDEAWDLFKKVAGHIAERSDIQSTAKKVTKKCAGLPLAVTTVAKALKHKENLYEWEDALELLKPSEININGISGAVYSAIQMSYTYLETEERKSTFLLCSIMGHDAVIKDLLKYCRGLGLFPRLDTMEKVRNRVLSLVNKLKDSSLLLAGSTPERFGIHDVVRDVAISIASRDRCWLALGEEDVFEGWSNECTMRNCDLVSLHYAKVSELPDGLECPNLTFFSMNGTVEVPDNFFNRIPRLKVLEFVGTNLTALPSTIGYLKTLCTLCLIDCDLQDIVLIGELRNLEILDLHGSAIVVLPDEIGQLIRLKLLDLNGCNNLQVVSPNVLSKLSNLEELYLYDFDKWEVEGTETPRSNASLVELQHLSRLTTLEIHIPNVKVMPNDNLFFGKMERYKISIGDDRWGSYYDEGMETSRMLKLKMNKSIVLVDGIKLLSRNAESLCLDGLKDVREILYDPNPESFRRLRFVNVKNCNMSSNLFSFSIAKRLHQFEQLEVSKCKTITELNIEEETIGEDDILEFSQLRILKLHDLDRFNVLWYSKNTSQPSLFDKKVLCSALEKLKLDSVSDIKEIWHIDDGVPLRSFGVQSLTCLTVEGCHKLKYVFTSSMVKSFVQLKKLKVSRCDEMEEVIEGRLMAREEEISSSLSVFPKLDYLRLENLPKLKRFCSGINPIEFSLLRHVIIQGCPGLKTLASDNGNDRTNVSLGHSYLFNEKVLCPVLEELRLDSVSGIEKIWHVDVQLPLMSFDAQSLTILEVRECHMLKYVFTSSMVKTFVQLKTLVISDCNEMEEVIEGRLTTEKEGINNRSTRVFPKLDSLELGNLPRFKRFCCSSNSVEFLSLRILKIRSCQILETFIFDDENSRVSLLLEKVILPELEQVKIDNMENLERLWPDRLVEHSFSKLTSIHLRNCHKLLHVFPSSMLARLHRLDRLSICDCKSVEEIIFDSQEGNSSSMPQFIQFQCLTSLTLIRLPNLKSMHHKMHTLDWPSLKEMDLSECDRVEILFASRGTIGGSSHHQPLFWVDESTFPNLQQLTLGWNAGIKESIQHCYGQQHQQLVSRYFRRLKVVKLVWYPEQVDMLPSYLFPWLSLPNLTLEISRSCFKEDYIFQELTLKGQIMQFNQG